MNRSQIAKFQIEMENKEKDYVSSIKELVDCQKNISFSKNAMERAYEMCSRDTITRNYHARLEYKWKANMQREQQQLPNIAWLVGVRAIQYYQSKIQAEKAWNSI